MVTECESFVYMRSIELSIVYIVRNSSHVYVVGGARLLHVRTYARFTLRMRAQARYHSRSHTQLHEEAEAITKSL